MNIQRALPLLLLSLHGALPIAAGAANTLLIAHEPIEIPESRGGFASLEVDAARDRLLLNHTGNGTFDILNLRTERLLKQLKTGPATSVTVDAARNRYYVLVGSDKKLVIIDRDKLEIVGEVTLPAAGDRVALGPPGVDRVFVGQIDGPSLWAIDPVAKRVTSTLSIPAGPKSMATEDDTGRIYLNIKSDNTVQVISASDGSSTIGAAWSTAPARQPQALLLDRSGEPRLFVAGSNGKLAVLKTSNGQLLSSTDTAMGVEQIAFDASKHRLYCPGGNGTMTVLDTGGTFVQPLGMVTIPRGARAVAVDPQRHSVWLAYTEGGKSFARKFTLAPAP